MTRLHTALLSAALTTLALSILTRIAEFRFDEDKLTLSPIYNSFTRAFVPSKKGLVEPVFQKVPFYHLFEREAVMVTFVLGVAIAVAVIFYSLKLLRKGYDVIAMVSIAVSTGAALLWDFYFGLAVATLLLCIATYMKLIRA